MRKESSLPALCLMCGYLGRSTISAEFLMRLFVRDPHTYRLVLLRPVLWTGSFTHGRSGKSYSSKVLLKVILLAYSRGIKGSRPIEKACRENVLFLAISGGHQPDHATIANFITSMKQQIMNTFVQVLMVCEEMNLLSGTHFSLDGLKLPSNASKDHSGTFKELKKKRAKLKEMIREHKHIDKLDVDPKRLEFSRQKHH